MVILSTHNYATVVIVTSGQGNAQRVGDRLCLDFTGALGLHHEHNTTLPLLHATAVGSR